MIWNEKEKHRIIKYDKHKIIKYTGSMPKIISIKDIIEYFFKAKKVGDL